VAEIRGSRHPIKIKIGMSLETNKGSGVHFSSIEKIFDAKVSTDLVEFIDQYKDQTVNKGFDRVVDSNFT
jgi:hypothetical protein